MILSVSNLTPFIINCLTDYCFGIESAFSTTMNGVHMLFI